VLDPSRRFLTIVLGLGTFVLLAAIAIGESMGDRVLVGAVGNQLNGVHVVEITPGPASTSPPFGPDWKRSQALAAAPDPRFPDPRVPPVPLPTPIPTPSFKPKALNPNALVSPSAQATYNPNIPIWRQKPLPTAAPTVPPVQRVTPAAYPSPSSSPSGEPPKPGQSGVTPPPARP